MRKLLTTLKYLVRAMETLWMYRPIVYSKQWVWSVNSGSALQSTYPIM